MYLRRVPYWYLGIVLTILVSISSTAHGQDLSQEELDQLRAAIRERLDELNYYNTVASFVNLNLYPDISSSRYDIDNTGGSTIHMIKFPYTYYLGPEDWKWKPFIEGNLSYLVANSTYDDLESLLGRFDTGENPVTLDQTKADTEWTGYSALIGLGVKIPIDQAWSFSPSVDVAWSRFENDTEFSGPGGPDYQELLDGLATNWTLDTLTYVGSLRIDYEKELDEILIHLIGKYSHMYTDFRHDDDVLDDFNFRNDIITGQIEISGSFGYSFKGNDLGWDLFFAHHRFSGEVGSLAGAVDYYNEAGAFIRADFAKEILFTNSLKLGASYVRGDDIEGYTFRLSFGF